MKVTKTKHVSKEDRKTFQRSFQLIKKFCPGIIRVKLISSLLSCITPYFSALMSGLIITGLISKDKSRLMLLILIFCGVTFLISTLCNYLDRRYSVLGTTLKIEYENYLNKVSNDMDFAKAESASVMALRDRLKHGDEQEEYGICSLPKRLSSVVSCIVSMIIAIVFCAYLTFHQANISGSSRLEAFANSPWLGVAFALCIALIIRLNMYGANKMSDINSVFMNKSSRLFNFANYYREQYLKDNKAAKDVRIFHLRDLILSDLEKNHVRPLLEERKELTQGEVKYESILTIVNTSIAGLIYLYIGLKAYAGILGIGSIVQYYGAIDGLFMAFGSFTYHFISLRKSAQHINILFDYLDIDNEMQKGDLSIDTIDLEHIEFEFCKVSYKYHDASEYALSEVSFKIRPGEHLAIVGTNGSGKTTIVKLLCRLYDPEKGVIKLNGIDIRQFKYEEYLKLFSVVFQDFKLFSFSIAQNIAASLEYDQTRIWNSLEMFGMEQRVKELPYALETNIYKQFDENGVDISGGESQKIAIARALYRNSNVVILDEPTAALDPESEFEIYKRFNSMIGKKTAFSISHRMSSCRICDRIIVCEKGRIVQSGSHEELLEETEGIYSRLWNSQAQHYKECAAEG